MKKKKYIIPIVILLLLIIINSFNTIINFITDYQWFRELGYTNTFLTKLRTQLKIGIPVFIIVMLVVYFYLISIRKKYYKEAGIDGREKSDKWINRIFGISSIIIAYYISSVFVKNLWFNLLQFINRANFNVKDPIFNNDLSFYVFILPLLKEIVELALMVIVILIVLTFAVYITLFIFRKPPENDYYDNQTVFDRFRRPLYGVGRLINRSAIKSASFQLGILGALILVIFGIAYVFNSYELLYSKRGVVFGAGFTDVNITLWYYRIMAVAFFVFAFLLIYLIKRKSFKKIILGLFAIAAISIIGSVGSGVVQRFIVEPDEISKEQEYIKYNIEYTQMAYGLEDVEEVEFPVNQDLTKEDIVNNEDIINNIRINDYRPISKTYNQLQSIRLYYSFNDVDIDRYNINGNYTQIFLAARELDQQNLQSKTWINKHLKYTHGYGLVLSPVNAVTSSGQPDLLIKNIPPVTNSNLKIERPEIYFGESTNDYIIINTDELEFDYPEGSDNKHTMYEGNAGVKLKGINRLLYAIKERDYKILISNNINSDSRIIMYRNIKERVKKIAPFIKYDDDPYIVLSEDGKLYWIIDGYTVTDKYPYSKPYSEESSVNYIRNSVKVVIDAYNGTTKFYVFDGEDPIIQTYMNIFPELFLDSKEMPEGLKSHVRYPITLFNIQAEVYRTYHVDNPIVFYNEEDLWDIAKEKYMSEELQVEPTYAMFKLPHEEDIEFLLTIPYTPKTKSNMTSFFVARNDGEDYGKLFIYKFPKGKTVDGPNMVESRIDTNTSISEELTLWSQQGSRVLRGNMMIVPVEDSLLYVEPIYLESDNVNSLPEMKRVIVYYSGEIVMEPTLEEALNMIFGISEAKESVEDEKIEETHTDTNQPENTENQELQQLIKTANELFNKAKEASQNGNWADYGKYIDELEKVLKELENDL